LPVLGQQDLQLLDCYSYLLCGMGSKDDQ